MCGSDTTLRMSLERENSREAVCSRGGRKGGRGGKGKNRKRRRVFCGGGGDYTTRACPIWTARAPQGRRKRVNVPARAAGPSRPLLRVRVRHAKQETAFSMHRIASHANICTKPANLYRYRTGSKSFRPNSRRYQIMHPNHSWVRGPRLRSRCARRRIGNL